MQILNKQKEYWFTKYKLFYVFPGGIVWESSLLMSRSLENHWAPPPWYLYGEPIARFILTAKNTTHNQKK